MDHQESLKPGGPPPDPHHPHADRNSPYIPHEETTKAGLPQQNLHYPPPYHELGQTQHGGVMNPGFVGLGVNQQYPYSPHPQPYIVQQVQGQPNMMVHHAVAQGPLNYHPSQPYVQQFQPTIIVKTRKSTSACGTPFSYRKWLVGIFFALLLVKILIAIIQSNK